jgi:predicted RNA-binding Zn-ribbon protein involved in translation (DUF1610 family)
MGVGPSVSNPAVTTGTPSDRYRDIPYIGVNQYLQHRRPTSEVMSLEVTHDCPECSNDRFWRTASTELHLGEKTKWTCTECEYGLIRIDGIDSSEHGF